MLYSEMSTAELEALDGAEAPKAEEILVEAPAAAVEPKEEPKTETLAELEARLRAELEEAITRFGLDPADYSWYCDLRRYGGTKHAGYGLGFERMIMYVTGVSNIRDVEAFPRTTGNADF